MSENTIQNPDDKSIIDRNNEILINILRVLTMLENSLNRLMRNNFYYPAQYPEEFFVIESFILQMRCWITDYKFFIRNKEFFMSINDSFK
ncbi:MAG: hypothetical protein OMM_11893 [Candidatus Magnetoglobus multicellularis str. Araruama]|uniref:Uncharacterized protein n=1 Tax=Candidatus Magnetoglobus multicellularis str. Araruama TaxID=890399 RepID=A0A1V1NX39_9BACT|nr:MAG: hypothetical protein OMM_11893 [Candidatus Magnetoglobus multicellularis str. Araruama]